MYTCKKSEIVLQLYHPGSCAPTDRYKSNCLLSCAVDIVGILRKNEPIAENADQPCGLCIIIPLAPNMIARSSFTDRCCTGCVTIFFAYFTSSVTILIFCVFLSIMAGKQCLLRFALSVPRMCKTIYGSELLFSFEGKIWCDNER